MIRLEGVCRNYQVGDQTVKALHDVDLTVAPGEYISIMGPSGSGKSTLLNVLGLLDRPTAGRYLLDGDDVTGLSDRQLADVRRNRIGFVFQFFHLVPRLSAAENIALPLVLAGMEPRERAERVAVALQEVGLSDRSDHRPEQLSGGQRQRVAMARATILNPEIILADEPTGNLDRHSGAEVLTLLENLNAKGITLLIVTHDPEIGGRAHRRIRMVDGDIESDTVTDA
ncbi:MAG: ABC transporter ATP-binding protein [Proteobacteria bacterium]|nr:MAG: ABC transporter ATP-binding protein [Pseudomonadota bacterium]QKK11044.1 MAG: ABC transporter ATP-binding protein [Pseudomonadota bacterium]